MQETVIKTIPKKNKHKKAKWLSKEGLQIAEKRKGKGKQEIRTLFECKVPRIARRNKKAFLSNQRKQIGENNRMRKTKDHFKNIKDTKGTFHAKMGTIKDRNSKDLIEGEEIKEKWQEYAEELYKKSLNDPDNHNGSIPHLETDILVCVGLFSS